MINLKFSIFQAMKQHIHAGEVVGSDIFLLPIDLANTVWPELFAHIDKQRTGPAGKIKHISQFALFSCAGVLAVKRDNTGKNGGDWLRSIELAGFFSGAGSKLADQIFIGVTQKVRFVWKFRKTLCNFHNYGAQQIVSLEIGFPKFIRIQVHL